MLTEAGPRATVGKSPYGKASMESHGWRDIEPSVSILRGRPLLELGSQGRPRTRHRCQDVGELRTRAGRKPHRRGKLTDVKARGY